ncbi:DUF5063 domain-containing protein [Paludibacter sp. 221]|uniref:DUF5063 domain-containing protein n=1 Tax=Paludibacter sp. 221 TaxID=2302939 RepID=UPI0013D7AA87|nr:DUF5063 domain-containing protein [Paludibacter sp. 221]NDV47760.1 DUF5063 domain-containing protein [Paludibacter sp. 221]
MNQSTESIVYNKSVIEFVTVVAETCLFLEKASEYSRNSFISQAIKILPLLYLKASVLETPEAVFEDVPERFVTEDDYQFVREQIENLLGNDNIYLEVYHPQMKYSDTPIAAFISEDLADIYQEIKDFAANFRLEITDIMNDALVVCLESFAEHWGQKLLNSLRALHALRYNEDFDSYDDDNENIERDIPLDRNSFIDHLRDNE